LNIQKLHVDLLSLSGCKLYGPKGTGLLYLKRGVKLQPTIYGGGQERGLKSGTENIPGIVGLAKALERSQSLAAAESKRLTALRNYFWQGIQKIYAQAHLNGDLNNRLPNNLNISFPGFEGETLLYKLDKAGIAVSTGSACSETSQEPSHVLKALGLSAKLATSSLRFSFGRQTTKKELDYVLKKLKLILK
jgi:cysteine desulfurase